MRIGRMVVSSRSAALSVLVLALAVMLGILTPTRSVAGPPDAAPPGSAPAGLLTSPRSTMSLVSWQPVADSRGYVVEVTPASQARSSQALQVAQSMVILTGLRPSTSYVVRVAAIDATGAVGPASQALDLTTTGTALPFAAPVPEVTSPTSTTLEARWSAPGLNLTYETSLADAPDGSSARTGGTADLTASWDGLAPDTAYFLKIRALDAAGKPASDWSPALPVRTSTQAPLRVASFNVKCETCGGTSWASRRGVVVSTILGQDPDVIGIQEASQGWLAGARISQFEDLAQRLGRSYALTNDKRNNCVRHWTPSGCRYRDQGASQGTRIIYNRDRLELLDQGSRRLLEAASGANDRYVAWAIFRQRATGKRFVFADTHLEPNASYSARNRQTTQMLATITANNPDRLPVIVVGDFNSHKWTKPANGPYNIMRSEGFVDPLGNAYRSTTHAAVGVVENRIRTNYSSYNDYKRQAPRFGYTNGTYLDYIFTTPMRVSEWETVVRVDSGGRFIGVIPSDHNMIRATVWLP